MSSCEKLSSRKIYACGGRIRRQTATRVSQMFPPRENLPPCKQAQLLQRDRATLCVMEYFSKSLKLTRGHSK